MKNILRYFLYLLIIIWLFVLPLRTGLYLLRSFKETTSPPAQKYDHIKGCENPEKLHTVEEKRISLYLSLGKTCKK